MNGYLNLKKTLAMFIILTIGMVGGFYLIGTHGWGKAAVEAGQTIYLPYIASTPYNYYYVDPAGNDNKGDGSAGNPWATISYASTQVEDRAIILVRPGTYNGRVEIVSTFDGEGIVIRSEQPYQARLRNNDQVLICFKCRGVTIEGFDIAHNGPGADRYVIQIQDVTGNGGRNVTLRNNVIHDSYNNDLLKLNNGAQDIVVEGNLFYNQHGQDSHLDITSGRNIIIQDNVFFNDFNGSNRAVENNTGSFLNIKDANGNEDGLVSSQQITVRRNVFLNWQGGIGNAFINFGDNSNVNYYHARDILIENNLLLGNSLVVVHAPFKLISTRDVTFRNNTIVGDMPSKAHGFRLVDGSQLNQNIAFYNNIWSDPTGTMGNDLSGDASTFAAAGEVGSWSLNNNLYWNGSLGIPFNNNQPINYTDDANAITGDPKLEANQSTIIPPRWLPGSNLFADGSPDIRAVFVNLVERYGRPGDGSQAIDRANPAQAAADDILGRPRLTPDIGAYER